MPRYPFDDLTPGNSFVIPAGETTPGNINRLCHYHGRRLGRSFSYRQQKDGSIRVGLRRGAIAIENVPLHDSAANTQAKRATKMAAIVARLRADD